MRSTPRFGLLVPSAILAAWALPAAAAAQYRLPTITAVARADSLHEAAEAMVGDPHRWRQAARLHRQSAALRTPEDSLAYRCLTSAGQVSFAANDLKSAQADLEAAGAQALARGDVEKAAHAYADAAWLARERKNPAQVWKLGRQAEILASSPLLTAQQRNRILQRFVHPDREYAGRTTR